MVLSQSLSYMWVTCDRFVFSGQFRCVLGLITSKSAAIAFTGLSTETSGGKLNFDRFLAYGRKINRQILNPERNLVVSKTKHSKTKTEARSTQNSKTKHPRSKTKHPKIRHRSVLIDTRIQQECSSNLLKL